VLVQDVEVQLIGPPVSIGIPASAVRYRARGFGWQILFLRIGAWRPHSGAEFFFHYLSPFEISPRNVLGNQLSANATCGPVGNQGLAERSSLIAVL
jgi:hypothetical protein